MVSAEKYSRRALRKVLFCRWLGVAFASIGNFFLAFAKFFDGCSEVIFLAECDAARRYKAATGYDLGGAAGYPLRYDDNPEEFATEGMEDDDGDW